MLAALVPLARAPEELPVRLLGIVLGLGLLWYAIRRIFGGSKKK